MCRVIRRLFIWFFLFLFPLQLTWQISCAEAASAVVSLQEFTADSSSQERLRFSMDKDVKYKTMILGGGKPRLVIDFMDSKYAGQKQQQLNGQLATGLRTGYHSSPVEKTRVVIDLHKSDIKYQVNYDSAAKLLVVVITRKKNKITTSNSTTKNRANQDSKDGSIRKEKQHEKNSSDSNKESGLVTFSKKGTVDVGETLREDIKRNRNKINSQQEVPTNLHADKKKHLELSETSALPDVSTSQKQSAHGRGADGAKATSKVEFVPEMSTQPPASSDPTSFDKATVQIIDIIYDTQKPGEERVRFRLNGFYPPNIYSDEQILPRVFCEFDNAAVAGKVKKDIITQGELVKRIMVRSQGPLSEKIKVTLELAEHRDFNLHQIFFKDENVFMIIVREAK